MVPAMDRDSKTPAPWLRIGLALALGLGRPRAAPG